jgi:hypothetical protein
MVVINLVLVAIGAILAMRPTNVSFACETSADLLVAHSPAGPWYTRTVPPLTDQVRALTRNLYPGASGVVIAYIKNVGQRAKAPHLTLEHLFDVGGPYPPPERALQPAGDVGDLSSYLVLSITYASSLRPCDAPTVVARGTLRELAVPGRVLTAPCTLARYSNRTPEIGIWRIELAVPESADNRIQGDRSCCTVMFGLSETR